MKNLLRDNPKHDVSYICTICECNKCHEFYEPNLIHFCKVRNSHPRSLAEDERIVRPRPFPIQSDRLLSTVEQYCDADGNISFKDFYYVVTEVLKHRGAKS